MLICGDCNAQNNDGERFCSNCGAYLVWQQTSAQGKAELTPQSANPGAGRKATATTAQIPVVPAAPGRPPRGDPSFGPTATVDPTQLEHLEERQPERSDPRLAHETDAQPRRSEAPLSPGGLTCRRCGADNKPEAGFCRQCGASLREAVVVPVPPWWRQLLGRTKPAALPAGSRPRWRKQKTISTGTVSFLTVLGLFAGAAFLGRDVIRVSVLRAVDEIWEKPVEVQSKTGSKTLPGHEVELAFDRTVRSWEPDGSVPPGTAYLQAGFGEPLRLTYVVITCGASQNPQGGLATVEIIAAGDGGNRSSRTVTLHENEAGPQSFYIGADRITTVRLNILKRSNPAAEPLSVAEVQFAGRT